MSGPWGVRGLSVRYGDRSALVDVTFQVAARSVVAVVGGDGAGKTTLLRALAGTVRPSAGTVDRPDERRIDTRPITLTSTIQELRSGSNFPRVIQVQIVVQRGIP